MLQPAEQQQLLQHQLINLAPLALAREMRQKQATTTNVQLETTSVRMLCSHFYVTKCMQLTMQPSGSENEYKDIPPPPSFI